MMNRQVALIIFLVCVFVLSDVNATSIQGVAVSPASLTTGASSVQSLLSNLPTSSVQSVTQSASLNVSQNSQLQDIAELKRRADESDQKIVRLIATTQELKDTSDQLKVSISQIANQQNAVGQASSVTQTSTGSASSGATQSVGTTQTVGMANIAGVLGVNPAANQATTQVITPNTTLPINNVVNVPSAAITQNVVANTNGVIAQSAGAPPSTNGVGATVALSQGSVSTASTPRVVQVMPADNTNSQQKNSAYPSHGYYPPPPSYYPPPPGYYPPPPPSYYPPPVYYSPSAYYPPPGYYPPAAYPPQGGVQQQSAYAQNYPGYPARHVEAQPGGVSHIANQSNASDGNMSASTSSAPLPQAASISAAAATSPSAVPTPVVDKITDLLASKLFGGQTAAPPSPSSNTPASVPASVVAPVQNINVTQGGGATSLPSVAAANGVSAVVSPNVPTGVNAIQSAPGGGVPSVPVGGNGTSAGSAASGIPRAVPIGGGSPGAVPFSGGSSSRVGNSPQAPGQSQEVSRPPVITLQESLRQRELLKQQGASTVPAAPNPAGQFFN